MEMHNLELILIIILIISIIFSLKYSSKYLIEKQKYNSFRKNVEKEYIKKNNIVLQNAVYEALIQAEEKNNSFEKKAYKKLLKELKDQR